jgi:hypothetical protein
MSAVCIAITVIVQQPSVALARAELDHTIDLILDARYVILFNAARSTFMEKY